MENAEFAVTGDVSRINATVSAPFKGAFLGGQTDAWR